MNFATIAQYLALAVQYVPLIQSAVATATSNASAVTKLTALAPEVSTLLEGIGATLFPKAAPTLHVLAGALAAFNPDMTKWLQGSLNQLVSPSPNLAVDGNYGPKTTAAVEQLQAKLGLTVDGLAGKITQAAITALLTPKPVLK